MLPRSRQPSRLSSATSQQQPRFSTCCGLEWLINSPSKFYIAPYTVKCFLPRNNSYVFIDDIRGSNICPCVLENANSSTPFFSRENASQCEQALSWILINNTCMRAQSCPAGMRLTPSFITNLYNCSFLQAPPDPLLAHKSQSALPVQKVEEQDKFYCYNLAFDMACEGEDPVCSARFIFVLFFVSRSGASLF